MQTKTISKEIDLEDQDKMRPYHEGIQAVKDGKQITMCPYANDMPDCRLWVKGRGLDFNIDFIEKFPQNY